MAASLKVDDLSSIKPFDPHGDPSNGGRRWRRWTKSFCLYADRKELIQADLAANKAQRVARSGEVLTTLLSNVKRNHRNLPSPDLVES